MNELQQALMLLKGLVFDAKPEERAEIGALITEFRGRLTGDTAKVAMFIVVLEEMAK